MLLALLVNGVFNFMLVCNFQFMQCEAPLSSFRTQTPIGGATNGTTLNPTSGLNIVSETVKTEGKDKIIFEGSVELRRDELTTFHSDKVVVEISDVKKVANIQMVGKVSMERIGMVIRSERAYSDNFDLYIDFFQNVTVTFIDGRKLKPKKVRYSFKTGDISMED